MADTSYWDHPSRRETKRLIDLADAGAILDELQQGSTEWDDAREALDHLVRGSRPEVERLRAERSIDLEALRVAAADLKRVRAELAETTHVLAATGEKAEALRGQRDQAETERDAARSTARKANTVLGEQIDRAIAAETERDRIRLAWESARRGRRSARLLNRELIASMDELHGRLQRYMDDKNTAAAHFTNQYSRMHLERDQMRTERDEAREQVKRVRAEHRPVAAHLGDPDDDDNLITACSDCEVPYPCPTVRALDGTEPGR